MQNDLLTKLSERMTRLIEANLSAPFPAVEVANPELVLGRDSLGRIPMVNMDGPLGSGRETPRSSYSDLSQRPDKVEIRKVSVSTISFTERRLSRNKRWKEIFRS